MGLFNQITNSLQSDDNQYKPLTYDDVGPGGFMKMVMTDPDSPFSMQPVYSRTAQPGFVPLATAGRGGTPFDDKQKFYSTGNSSTFDNFMERMVGGGLLAIGGGALAAGAGAGAAGAGAAEATGTGVGAGGAVGVGAEGTSGLGGLGEIDWGGLGGPEGIGGFGSGPGGIGASLGNVFDGLLGNSSMSGMLNSLFGKAAGSFNGKAAGSFNLGSLLNIAQGAGTLALGNKILDTTRDAAKLADPFGGQRPQYMNMLSNLMADPSSITKTPGYEAGLDAVNRGMAKGGYLGSGNQMIELQKYGGNAYNDQVNRLMTMAGAGINPGTAAQTLIGGTTTAANALAGGLGQITYGMRS